MKKVLSYILISVILLANLLAPVSVGLGSKNGIEIQKTITQAAETYFSIEPVVTSNSITVNGSTPGPEVFNPNSVIIVTLYDFAGNKIDEKSQPIATNNEAKVTYSIKFEGLSSGTSYTIKTSGNGLPDRTLEGVYTLNAGGQQVKPIPTKINTVSRGNAEMPACSINPLAIKGSVMGCIGQAFYYVLFLPTSYLFALAGTMFDYTFHYSVQDSSYRSAFVVQGWGLVRDFCNMFFIFIMLYVAIGTILSLHSMKTKETIINVVIIGLFINFSLFATQLIIDASNITARVFYNADAIKITPKDASGVTNLTPGLDVGPDGVIPLSAAIVSKVNPQNIIMNSNKINYISSTDSKNAGGVNGADEEGLSVGQFILIVIIASAVNIVGLTVFLTVGFLFIARVVGLWMAMILAPLAFFTYILPEMAGTKMIGWKNWWGDTLKLAFLAPVFIFFMYIILKFLQIDLISDIASKSVMGDGLGYFVSLIVPFAFIMILMMKAKKIAVDMSGEFGEMAVKAGSAVGGMALGGAIGVGAMAMRGTIGKAGAMLADSKFAKSSGFGRIMGDAGRWTASKSFDVRNTKAGASAAGSMGVDAGKGKTGGFTQARIDQKIKAEKRKKDLELSENSPEKTKVRKLKVALKELENEKSHEVNSLEGQITAAKDKRDNANKALQADPQNKTLQDAAMSANKDVLDLVAQKGNITSGGPIKDANGNITGYHTSNGKISQTEVDNAIKEEKKNSDAAAAATANTTKVKEDSEETEKTAKEKALEEKKKAIITATEKASADERAAIEDAKNAEVAAIKLAKEARQKALLEPQNTTLAAAAKNATLAADNASSNVNTITATASATKIRTISNATMEAEKEEKAAIEKAAEDKKTAIEKAEKEEKAAIDKAAKSEATATAARKAAENGTGKSINELKFTDIPKAEHDVHHLENEYLMNYAESQRGFISKAWNYAKTAGEYDFDAAEVSADNIITGTVTPKGDGGGGGDHGSHATPATAHTPTNTTANAKTPTHPPKGDHDH